MASDGDTSIIFSAPGKSVMTFESSVSNLTYQNETGEKIETSQNGTFESYMHMITSNGVRTSFSGRIVSYVKEWEAEPFTKELKGCSNLCFDDIKATKHLNIWENFLPYLPVVATFGGVLFIALIVLIVLLILKYLQKRRKQFVDASSLIGERNEIVLG